MQKVSANQALENAILWAFLEMLEETKRAGKGSDNVILREIKGLHHNTTKADMPEHLKKALGGVVQGSMGYLRSNGYIVTPIEK